MSLVEILTEESHYACPLLLHDTWLYIVDWRSIAIHRRKYQAILFGIALDCHGVYVSQARNVRAVEVR